MRTARRLCLLSLLVILAGGGVACHRDECVPFCMKTAKALNCTDPEHCKAQCKQLHESPVCQKEFKVFEACMLKQPPDRWVCDESENTPALKEGVCMPERVHVSDCLSAAPPPAPTPAQPKKP